MPRAAEQVSSCSHTDAWLHVWLHADLSSHPPCGLWQRSSFKIEEMKRWSKQQSTHVQLAGSI